MWIRSQNKQLLGQYKFLFVRGTEVHAECTLDVDTLGKYETEERAIEVLDEIQNHIGTLEHNKMYIGTPEEQYSYEHYIFKMPQK